MTRWVKVIFRQPHPSFGYFAGQTGIVEAKRAEQLLQEGYIIIAPDIDDIPPKPDESASAKELVNPLPSDFPARIILFDAGFDTVEKILEAGETITDIKGIGRGTLRQIESWIKKH